MSIFRRRLVAVLYSTALGCCAWQAAAAAEATGSGRNEAKDTENLEEVIVTGTLVRGIAPAGTNVIAVTQKDVQSTGATTISQLMQSIPQMGSFNNYQGPSGLANDITTSRPNLRNLPGFNTSGTSSTLLLVDGRRLVGMGIQSTSPDPDIVPPGLLERLEIVPDGGSAIYGSDAVAGVINFITKKKFDGVAADARYGRGDRYNTFDANLTAGTNLGRGSIYFSWNFSRHDQLFGRDRDYVKMFPVARSGLTFPITSVNCTPGNVQAISLTTFGPSGPVYKLPFATGTAVPNTANQCDESDPVSIYPNERRHSFFAGLSQDLGRSNKLDVQAFVMDRRMEQTGGAFSGVSTVGTISIPGFATFSPFVATHRLSPASPFEIQQVTYNWGGADAYRQYIKLKTWGIAPTLTTDLGHGWQLRTLASFSYSRTQQASRRGASPNLAIAAGLFNPYDPAASDPTTLNVLLNSNHSVGLTRQRLFNLRSVVDGDLFAMPGGAAKLAGGIEYVREKVGAQINGFTAVDGYQDTGFPGASVGGVQIVTPLPPVPVVLLSRTVKSAFTEVVFPFVSSQNSKTGVRELTLSAAARYDDYSDVGSTTNPKIGLTYKPVDSVRLRAAWGKSFVAPSLITSPLIDPGNPLYIPSAAVAFLQPPASLIASGRYPAVLPGQNTLLILGSAPGIKPQTAKTASFGVDFDPPFVPGLNLSLTYWKIDYSDVIALPGFTDQLNFWSNLGAFITVAPTLTQINAVNALASGAVTTCTPLPGCVYAIMDARKTNLGLFLLRGLDFAAHYARPTGFGSLDFSVNANYELKREQSAAAGAPLIDLIKANVSRFRGSASAGAEVGKLRTQATLYHTQGYSLNPGVGIGQVQTHVSSFDVVNLFFKYDVSHEGMYKDLAVTLNVDNILDRDPPVFQQNNITPNVDGYVNGWTLGRVVQLGVSKKF